MDHNFIPSIGNGLLCAKCKKDAVAHSDMAECESCANIGKVSLHYGTMLMCDDCWNKEQELQKVNQQSANQRVADARQDMDRRLAIVKQMDEHVQIKTDVFNAKTMAIVELKKLIDDNASIQNKPYHLAETLVEKFKGLRSAIFELNEKITDMANEQKAIQVYLNTLGSQLKAEEREKLKLENINYEPKQVKTVTPKVTVPKVKTVAFKLEKADIRKYALECGISESNFYMMCYAKKMQAAELAAFIKSNMNQAQINTVPEKKDGTNE